ncbi:hypothetical protein V6N12_069692 [Hibiscus sabdariffa]|uniref:DUF4283 domain-containing protein n=1 Tax=Hibiscus sabdariffa TaxID=183260 RepID=A0ABR2FEZ2_9ROSI
MFFWKKLPRLARTSIKRVEKNSCILSDNSYRNNIDEILLETVFELETAKVYLKLQPCKHTPFALRSDLKLIACYYRPSKVIFDGVTASVKVIFTVSLQANPSKVTGIDGMSAGFFQEHWFVVKDDVMKACSALFNPNQSTARVPGLVLNKASSLGCPQIQVEGIVDRVIVEKLRACVIGTTKKIYESAQLLGIHEEKGWDEFDVQYVAGNQFILMFDREEMAASCLECGWEWLSEFFSDLRRWHKEFTPKNRVTWVEVLGVPLHAWNNYTFNNILNRWGELLFIEDEHLVGKDFSSKRAKTLTNHMELIEESMSLNCDGDLFKVWVRELNSTLGSAQDLTNSKEGFLESGYNSEKVYSKSESTFVANSSTHLQQNSGDVVFAPTGEVERWWLLKFQG